MSTLFDLESKILDLIPDTNISFVDSLLKDPFFTNYEPSNSPKVSLSNGNPITFIYSFFYKVAELLISDPWYCYGFLPVFSIAFASIFSVLFLDSLLLCENYIRKYLLIYTKGENRFELIKKQHQEIPYSVQLKELLMATLGPLNLILNTVALRYLLFWANDNKLPTTPLPTSSLIGLFLDCYIIAVIADLILYIFHRLQHENEYLWKAWHSKHHKITTPTAVSTIYIAPEDSFLGAGVALAVAQMIVRPHPITAFIYLNFHMANTCANHCGYETFWLNLILFKWLPMRVTSRIHDQHHRLGNRGKGAKNYAEFFNWDIIFGTYVAPVAKQQQD